MKTGDELVLRALRNEFTRLSRFAEKEKAKSDEYQEIGTEFVAIHKGLVEIVNSKEHGKATIKRLDALQERRDKANRVMKKDFIKLLDKQHDAESDRDKLGQEIATIEFRQSLRKGEI